MDIESQTSKPGPGGLNKSGKVLGNGTTHKIRSHLKFTDEKEWKRFSSRRLELIDTFGLSEHKASEQDANIKQIAAMLRVEFNYPVSAAPEFEKLVTAAVQSVRRNRKRSRKRIAKNMFRGRSGSGSLALPPGAGLSGSSSSLNYQSPSSMVSPSLSVMSSPRRLGVAESASDAKFEHQFSLPPPTLTSGVSELSPRLVSGATTFRSPGANNPGFHAIERHALHSSVSVPAGLALKTVIPPPGRLLPKHPDPIPSGVGTKLSTTTAANGEQLVNIRSKSGVSTEALNAVFSHLISGTPVSETVRSHMSSSDDVCIPAFLKEEFVKKVRDSCSCQYMHYEISHGGRTIEDYTLVELLGRSAINTAIASVIEKTSSVLGLSPILPSPSSLRDAKFRTNFLDNLSFGLFDSVVPRDILSTVNGVTTEHKVEIFHLIVGSMMKDFGFDPTLRLLSEIAQCYISSFCPISNNDSVQTGDKAAPRAAICPPQGATITTVTGIPGDKSTVTEDNSRNGSASSVSTGRYSLSSGRSLSLNTPGSNDPNESSGLNILSTISMQMHGHAKGTTNGGVQQPSSLQTKRSISIGGPVEHATYLDSNAVLPKPQLPMKKSFADSYSLPHPMHINTCESYAPG